MRDLQCAWLLLLFCASARANHLLRVVHPSWSDAFARAHDTAMWNCFRQLLDIPSTQEMMDRAGMSLANGGLGLRSASRDKVSAYWASWADALPTIQERHPVIADQLCVALQRGDRGPHVAAAAHCRELLITSGFDCPEWGDVARGLQLGQVALEDPMLGIARRGWQRGAALHAEEQFRTVVVWPRLHPGEQALLRSQSGPLAGVPFSCVPSSAATRFEFQEFRVLLLRRLWCPLPLSASSCRCGRPLDPSGHHRAACPHAGVLGRRGFSLESAAARVCREAGGRVTTNVRVQDLDLPPRAGADNHRLEVVADGLPLFHGAQLAIDTTMVSPLRRDGSPRRQCAARDGAAMAQARARKERTCPELAQAHGRVRLVVLACEVGPVVRRGPHFSPLAG